VFGRVSCEAEFLMFVDNLLQVARAKVRFYITTVWNVVKPAPQHTKAAMRREPISTSEIRFNQ
jgi:hypothetical protein